MNKRRRPNATFPTIPIFAVLFVSQSILSGIELDRVPAGDEVSYRPADGERVAANPPAFVWLPDAGRAIDRWIIEYAPGPDFADGRTERVTDLDMTVHVPGEPLEPGKWYWRYGYVDFDGGENVFSHIRALEIPEDATIFPFPTVETVIDAIPDTRPRAYFSPEDRDKIRENPEAYAWLVDSVVRQAENVLNRNEPLFEEPKPWDQYGDDSRQVYVDTWRAMRPYTRGMEICARAYLFTGDERFAEEANRRLMHFMTWDVDGPSSVYWPTELGMDIAEHAPRTFDWIYDTFTDEERETCIDVLGKRIRQINEMHRGRPFETRPFSSHPGRMIGFAVEGGIILAHEVDDARDWIEYTLRVLWSTYPAWGRDDGAWHEGVSYWTWYIGRITRVVGELDRFGIPLKDKPFFQNTGDFGLYAAYPNRSRREFGDSYSGSIGRAQGNVLYALASLYNDPYYRWYAAETGGGPSGPEAFQVRDDGLEPKAPGDRPQSKAFFDVGWVAMHSDMAAPDDNVMVLFKSSTFGSISHDHANQNAFVIEAYGEPLAVSTGYYQNYGDPHHREWMWQTRAHNAILVDGEGQVPRSPESRGKIVEHIEEESWAYALGDAVEAYGGRLDRAYRHVLFLRPDVIIVADDLAASDGSATYQWLLHAENEMTLNEEAGEVMIEHGDARLHAQFLHPQGLSMSQNTGWDPEPTRPEAAPEQFHVTASTGDAEETRIVTLLTTYRSGDENDAVPDAELVESSGGVAIAVKDKIILIRDPYAAEVRTDQHNTVAPAAVFSRDDTK